MNIVAHGSGIDELIAFLAVPALFLLYHLVRKLLGRGRRDVPAEPDDQPSDRPSA